MTTSAQVIVIAWLCLGAFWLALALVGLYDGWVALGEVKASGLNGLYMATANGKFRMWVLHLTASLAVLVSGVNALRPEPSGSILLIALFGIVGCGPMLALVDLTKGWRLGVRTDATTQDGGSHDTASAVRVGTGRGDTGSPGSGQG